MAILVRKNKIPELLQKNKPLIFRQNTKNPVYKQNVDYKNGLFINVVEENRVGYSENNSGLYLITEKPNTSKLDSETFMSPFLFYVNEEDKVFSTIEAFKSTIINIDKNNYEMKETTYNSMYTNVGPHLDWSNPIVMWVDYKTDEIEDKKLNIQTSYKALNIHVRDHDICYFYDTENSYVDVLNYNFKETVYNKFKVDIRSNEKPEYIEDFTQSAVYNIQNLKNVTVGTPLELFIETEDKSNLIEQENFNGKELVILIDEFTELKQDNTQNVTRYEWNMGPITNTVTGDATGLETVNIEMQKNTFCRYTFKFSNAYITDIKGLPPGLSYNQTTLFGSVSVAGDYMCTLELNNGNELGMTIKVPGVRRLM